jgi:hypothetical protein
LASAARVAPSMSLDSAGPGGGLQCRSAARTCALAPWFTRCLAALADTLGRRGKVPLNRGRASTPWRVSAATLARRLVSPCRRVYLRGRVRMAQSLHLDAALFAVLQTIRCSDRATSRHPVLFCARARPQLFIDFAFERDEHARKRDVRTSQADGYLVGAQVPLLSRLKASPRAYYFGTREQTERKGGDTNQMSRPCFCEVTERAAVK